MKRKGQKGFTLLEIIIVIALIALFSALIAPVGMDFYRSENIERQANLLKKNLELARDQAISGKLDSAWSIKFEENKYTIFKGDDWGGRNETYDKEFNIPSSMEIELEGEIDEITFEKITGGPSYSNNITLDYGETQRVIKISKEGLIFFE